MSLSPTPARLLIWLAWPRQKPQHGPPFLILILDYLAVAPLSFQGSFLFYNLAAL